MAHKTLIGGTAYEVSGGKTLVDGTAYSIKNGKTLVEGTAYEVRFIHTPVINLVIRSAILVNVEFSRCIIDGISYNLSSTGTQLQLPVGTTIECYVSGGGVSFGHQNREATISVNNQIVISTSADVDTTETVSFIYTVTGDATITLAGARASGNITITEE